MTGVRIALLWLLLVAVGVFGYGTIECAREWHRRHRSGQSTTMIRQSAMYGSYVVLALLALTVGVWAWRP